MSRIQTRGGIILGVVTFGPDPFELGCRTLALVIEGTVAKLQSKDVQQHLGQPVHVLVEVVQPYIRQRRDGKGIPPVRNRKIILRLARTTVFAIEEIVQDERITQVIRLQQHLGALTERLVVPNPDAIPLALRVLRIQSPVLLDRHLVIQQVKRYITEAVRDIPAEILTDRDAPLRAVVHMMLRPQERGKPLAVGAQQVSPPAGAVAGV